MRGKGCSKYGAALCFCVPRFQVVRDRLGIESLTFVSEERMETNVGFGYAKP